MDMSADLVDSVFRVIGMLFISTTHTIRGGLSLSYTFLADCIALHRATLQPLLDTGDLTRTEIEMIRCAWWACFIMDKIFAAIGRRKQLIADHEIFNYPLPGP